MENLFQAEEKQLQDARINNEQQNGKCLHKSKEILNL